MKFKIEYESLTSNSLPQDIVDMINDMRTKIIETCGAQDKIKLLLSLAEFEFSLIQWFGTKSQDNNPLWSKYMKDGNKIEAIKEHYRDNIKINPNWSLRKSKDFIDSQMKKGE